MKKRYADIYIDKETIKIELKKKTVGATAYVIKMIRKIYYKKKKDIFETNKLKFFDYACLWESLV